jgi:hypothetical protein
MTSSATAMMRRGAAMASRAISRNTFFLPGTLQMRLWWVS